MFLINKLSESELGLTKTHNIKLIFEMVSYVNGYCLLLSSKYYKDCVRMRVCILVSQVVLGTLVRTVVTYSLGTSYVLGYAQKYLTNVCIDQLILIVLALQTENYNVQYNRMMCLI